MIIVSGIQPSGLLHLGNYFGAIQQQIALQNQGEAYYFIANYHALTSLHDAEKLRKYTFDIAAAYLALGLNPEKAALFKQSDVPEVTELSWILNNVTPFGSMHRAHAFKDKVEKGLSANIGLFTYPILMAADILIYGGELVPVGQDQVQHVEIAKDIASSFNHAFGQDFFKEPKYQLSVGSKVPGIDGEKMAKSRGNVIPLFGSPKEIQKAVSSIVTDSKDYTKEPLDPVKDTIFKLYSLMATMEEVEGLRQKYLLDRTFGYGHAKQLLKQKIEITFAEANQKYSEFQKNPQLVEAILQKGATKARDRALVTLKKVRQIVGLD